MGRRPGPAGGRAAGAEVRAAATPAAEECGQLAFPRGWGPGPCGPPGGGQGKGALARRLGEGWGGEPGEGRAPVGGSPH